MVVGAFPAAKLGALLLKQISKPIANALKNQAKSSPVFRKYICMPPAQFYNWCEVKSKMWILNLGKPVNIPVLNEAMAIELGANLLGEGIIFMIAAGILIAEYNRSANKEYAKEEAKKQEMTDLQNTIRELFIQTEEQSAQLRELTRKLIALETKIGVRATTSDPPKPKSVPKSPAPPTQPKSLPESSEGGKIFGFTGNPAGTPDTLANNYDANDQNFSLNSMTYKEKHIPQIHHTTIVLRAVDEVEDQFWGYPLVEHQEENIIFLSLYHVQKLLRILN